MKKVFIISTLFVSSMFGSKPTCEEILINEVTLVAMTGGYLAFKVAKAVHESSVYSFDKRNTIDKVCSTSSGVIAVASTIGCFFYGPSNCSPGCLPIATTILSHNVLKIAQRKMTPPLAATYNTSINNSDLPNID